MLAPDFFAYTILIQYMEFQKNTPYSLSQIPEDVPIAVREFMFPRKVGLTLRSTLSLRINTKIIGNMN